MRFCAWYPLAEGTEHAPPSPGVFQIRLATGLIDYPTGKSAMVHYEVASDLRAAVTTFAGEHRGRAWLCRHTVEMSPQAVEDIEVLYRTLIRDFTNRFGRAPTVPSIDEPGQ